MAPNVTPKWRSRIVGHAEVDPSTLVANPLNWRKHPAAQNRAIEGALETLGWVQQVIVNKGTGKMIDGHARVALAVKRGEAAVPVVYVDLSPEEERAALASLDPIAGLAVTDSAKLFAVTTDLQTGNLTLDAFLREQHEAADVMTPRAVGTEGPRKTNDPAAVVKCVIPAIDLRTVEQALEATGQMNRGEALLTLCRSFLDHAKRQHDAQSKGGTAPLAPPVLEKADPARAGVARRVRKTVRPRVRGSVDGGRVRNGHGESELPRDPAADVASV
jgi:hypothetical protein